MSAKNRIVASIALFEPCQSVKWIEELERLARKHLLIDKDEPLYWEYHGFTSSITLKYSIVPYVRLHLTKGTHARIFDAHGGPLFLIPVSDETTPFLLEIVPTFHSEADHGLIPTIRQHGVNRIVTQELRRIGDATDNLSAMVPVKVEGAGGVLSHLSQDNHYEIHKSTSIGPVHASIWQGNSFLEAVRFPLRKTPVTE